MKYLLKVLIIALVILFCLKLIIHLFDKGHEVSYTVQNFNIKETLKVDSLNKTDNYYFEIKHEKFKLNFQVFKEYNKSENIINKIMYHKMDNYECILPIFKNNEILTDIMCLKNNEIIYYHDIKDTTSDMKQFVTALEKYGYNKNRYIDNASAVNVSGTQKVYEENIVDNHYIAFENYKGLSLIGSDNKTVELFENDVYKKPVSIFTDKYYIVADYNSEYTFKKIYVVNLVNGNMSEIRSYNEISFDSIMQGAVDGKIYLFDKDEETQYEVDLDRELVKKVNNQIKYYNGKWTTMTLKEAKEGKTFNNYYSNSISGYDKVDKTGTTVGYYYLYKKKGDKYLVYRADVQNTQIKTYLFETSDLKSIIYIDEYIYYRNKNTWNYYHDNCTHKIIENSELEFNDDISLGVYIK